MKITFFSIAMSIIWGSALMVLFTILRKRSKLIDICSVSGIIVLYIFCAVRMMVPVELPWVKVIPAETLFNALHLAIRKEVSVSGVKVYHIVAGVWITGAIVKTADLVLRYIKYKNQIAKLAENGKSLETSNYGVKAPSVKIIQTQAVDTPLSFGLLDRIILIPDEDYSDDDRALIIRHEYMHLINNDLAVQFLINMLCAIYWWNPFVYLLRLDLEQYFELRCDSNVTQSMSESQIADYLDVLLKVYKKKRRIPNRYGIGLLGTHKRRENDIKERFIMLSKGQHRRKRTIGKIAAIVIASVFMVISYSFIFQSNYDVPDSEIGIGTETYEVDTNNSYIIKRLDGKYYLHTKTGKEKILSKETVDMLKSDGFSVVEEE